MVECSKSNESIAKRSIANQGEKNPNAKLIWENIEFIRSSDMKIIELAKKFNIARSTISNIRSKKMEK
jgi:hypothetical protein